MKFGTPAYNEELSNAIGKNYEYVHVSGHADPNTLGQLFMNVNAKMIIPMHTTNPKKFLERFPWCNYECRLYQFKSTTFTEYLMRK